MATENEILSEVFLDGTARVEGDKLVVDYSVRNSSQREIYVFDVMQRQESGKRVIDANGVDRFFEEPTTLRLVRGILQLPMEKDVKIYLKPFARLVPAKGEVKGNFKIDIPVQERSAFYGLAPAEATKPVECRSVRLLIGWIEFKKGMDVLELDVDGQKVFDIAGSWEKPFQKLVEKTFDVKVSIAVRTGSFDRQMPLQ